jgi:nucleoid DNA-binding protein
LKVNGNFCSFSVNPEKVAKGKNCQTFKTAKIEKKKKTLFTVPYFAS